MSRFTKCKPSLSRKYQNKQMHGGNHAPSVADWFRNDDTLDRQGISAGKPNGHGICKGVASAWVIAFLNGVREATDSSLFEQYYTDFLRYQATMIKDFGKHIDSHVAQLNKLDLKPNVKEYKNFQAPSLRAEDIPNGRWGIYMSVWQHDIAAGGTWGTGGKQYIVEPNTGLLGYDSITDFLHDLNEYIDSRRTKKNKQSTDPAGFWIYQTG